MRTSPPRTRGAKVAADADPGLPVGVIFPVTGLDPDTGAERWSLQTLMFYLNDDYGRGSTRFYSPSQCRYKAPDKANITAAWKPTAGSCLIFNQQQCHDGEEVEDGCKYIMRTEVLYRDVLAVHGAGD